MMHLAAGTARRAPTAALIVGVALFTAAATDRSHAQTPAGGMIAGTVVTASSPTLPMRHARVVLSSDHYWRALLTEEDGRFAFRDLPPDRYKLLVNKAAYITSEYGEKALNSGGTRIELAAAQRMTDIVLTLTRGAVLAGTIRDTSGAPAADVAVVANLKGLTYTTLTNALGEYRLFSLLPGDYTIFAQPPRLDRFSPPALVMSTAQVDAMLAELQAGTSRTTGSIGSGVGLPDQAAAPRAPSAPPQVVAGYAPVYYPGTVDTAAAQVITLRAAEERVGLDFALILGGTARIRGRVVDAQGRPPSGALVTATAAGSTRPPMTASTTKDGTFEIPNASPGHYALQVRANAPASDPPVPSAERTQTRWWALADVDAYVGDVADVSMTLQPPMSVSGRVVVEPSATQPRATPSGVRINLVRQVGGTDAGGPPTSSALVQADGSFQMTGIDAGTFRITATGGIANGTTWWLRSAEAGGRDLLDRPIELGRAANGVSNAVLTLSSRHTELGGTFRSPAGTPAPDYFIVVFPVDPAAWVAGSRRLAFARPATTGRYEFRELPAGDYYVAALTMLSPSDWTRRSFLEQLVQVGVKVTVTDGGRTSQDLQISR